ncbi:acyl carrier protein [Microbacterium resistens]|uniref:Acyl carrier protein n=1 Tax=Microbacterium resistens TaxID=156977 RepID=A0ABU1S9N0_9MICO|nr:acyl carrier protein [Microbacterium resistens]MDR6866320.1 acyl carrier protein [Microbacterium resistens]
MDEKALLKTVAEILEVDEVSLDTDLEDLGWDSLSNLSFIAEVDDAAGLTIDADQLTEAKTVADLKALVDAARA